MEESSKDALTSPVRPVKETEYLGRSSPTIRGIKAKPREEHGREVFESQSQQIAFRRVGEKDLDSCQDCWAVSVDQDNSRVVVGTDGVGSTLCGA